MILHERDRRGENKQQHERAFELREQAPPGRRRCRRSQLVAPDFGEATARLRRGDPQAGGPSLSATAAAETGVGGVGKEWGVTRDVSCRRRSSLPADSGSTGCLSHTRALAAGNRELSLVHLWHQGNSARWPWEHRVLLVCGGADWSSSRPTYRGDLERPAARARGLHGVRPYICAHRRGACEPFRRVHLMESPSPGRCGLCRRRRSLPALSPASIASACAGSSPARVAARVWQSELRLGRIESARMAPSSPSTPAGSPVTVLPERSSAATLRSRSRPVRSGGWCRPAGSSTAHLRACCSSRAAPVATRS